MIGTSATPARRKQWAAWRSEELEAWILALSGVRNTEAMTGPASEMANRLGGSDLDRMIEVVEAADLRAIPDDARSLLDWLARARNVLAPD